MRFVTGWACTMLVATAEGLPPETQAFLKQHCYRCHGAEQDKGDLNLEAMNGRVTAPQHIAAWRQVVEVLSLGAMPPRKERQPESAARQRAIGAIQQQLAQAGQAVDLAALFHDPAKGNRIDHDKLFDGSIEGPAWSPPRMWRRSQPQYDALMEALWVLPKLRYDYATQRGNPEFAHFGYAQPFPQMDPDQFTNYAGGVHADTATLKALLDAGQQLAQRLTATEVKYHPLHQPVIQIGFPHAHKKGIWGSYILTPPQRAVAFQPFLTETAAPSPAERTAAIQHVFQLLHNRAADEAELARYGAFLAGNIKRSGPAAALRGLITAVVTSPEFVFRMELGMTAPDKTGRRLLAPRELMYALAHALTDQGPDAALVQASQTSRLQTRADVEREVRRMLQDDRLEKSMKLRFWQEFFGYPNAMTVFKDKKDSQGQYYPELLVRDADQQVEHVLQRDRHVFRELLTFDRYFVGYPTAGGNDKLRAQWIEAAQQAAQDELKNTKQRKGGVKPPNNNHYSAAWLLTQGKTIMPKARHNDAGNRSRSYVFIYGFDPKTMNWSPEQPMQIPDPRLGMLMHPAWLMAHSTNFDNDIVGRGHWIRERLFAGTMPAIPINVEAQVPDSETQTLRQRMEVTRKEYCWQCHQKMDPLGLPFESFDHYGWYRTEEFTDARGRRRNKVPVETTGAIAFSGEPGLDGPVADARELVRKLADSKRVRQSIIRHAFRFWMGRNEMLSDSPTLRAADRAYVESDGSFNEMLVALLTSDSFLYRK